MSLSLFGAGDGSVLRATPSSLSCSFFVVVAAAVVVVEVAVADDGGDFLDSVSMD